MVVLPAPEGAEMISRAPFLIESGIVADFRPLSQCTLASKTLSFEDTIRKDFRPYGGSWKARALSSGTEATYRLEAEPDFMAPSLLLRRGLKRGAKDLLDQVRAKIRRGK